MLKTKQLLCGELGTIELLCKLWIRVVAGGLCKLDTVIPRRIILNISVKSIFNKVVTDEAVKCKTDCQSFSIYVA